MLTDFVKTKFLRIIFSCPSFVEKPMGTLEKMWSVCWRHISLAVNNARRVSSLLFTEKMVFASVSNDYSLSTINIDIFYFFTCAIKWAHM